jgi:hypothetical protein
MRGELSSCSAEELENYLIECHEKELDSEVLRVTEELFSRIEEDEFDDNFEIKEEVPKVKSNTWFPNIFIFLVPVLYALKINFQGGQKIGDGEATLLAITTFGALIIYSISFFQKKK